MAENPTTYEKTEIIAVKLTAEKELKWYTSAFLRKLLCDQLVGNPEYTPELVMEHGVKTFSVESHSCPKLAAGSVDAAFRRIDRLEERLVTLIDSVLARALEKFRATREAAEKPKHTF